MDYRINEERNNYYLPVLKHWIHDTFGLNLTEAMIYNLILQNEVITWTSDYIAGCVYCTGKTVRTTIKKLCDMGLVKKLIVPQGTNKRWVLIALYTEEGRKSEEEIKRLAIQGCRSFKILQKKKESEELDKWIEKEIINKH